MPRRSFMLFVGLCLAAGAPAQTVRLATGQSAPLGEDGRLFGHFPYGEVSPGELAPAPTGFAAGNPCLVHRDMIPDLTRLLAAADAAGLGEQLRGLSCHRTIERQGTAFCRVRDRCSDVADRARQVGPPGYSEHATGYAIDFGVRPATTCHDLDPCFAQTAAGRWLRVNARTYGFELSFPAGNAQRVTWEPWHWRWVGPFANAPGAPRARATFARARTHFPANPGIVPLVIRVTSQPPVPVPVPVVVPACADASRRSRSACLRSQRRPRRAAATPPASDRPVPSRHANP